MPDNASRLETAVSSKFGLVLLVALCLLIFTPGQGSLPTTDRDEARFAQASKQMLETGNYVDIRFQEVPRYKKPIGIYWLQTAAVCLSNAPLNQIGPYRLPSLLGALLAVVCTALLGARLFDRRTGLLAGLLLAGCLLLNVEARLAKTDAMLLLCIVIMQSGLARLYLARQRETAKHWPGWIMFWLACGLGILIKGPVPLVIAAATILTLMVSDRSLDLLRVLRPLPGLLLLAGIVLPWFIAIQSASHGAFIQQALFQDFLPKLLSGQESHGAPPGYYLLLFPVLFWPGSLLTIAGLPRLRSLLREERVRFLLAWIIPAWIIFELVPTKLPHYVLPFFPAIALLTACALQQSRPNPGRERLLKKLPRWLGSGLWLLATVILGIGLPVLAARFGRFQALDLLPFAGLLLMLVAGWQYRHDRACVSRLVPTFFLVALLTFPPAFAGILPQLELAWPSRHVAEVLSKQSPGQLISVGYSEPSLPFLVGTKTVMTSLSRAALLLHQEQYRYLLVEAREQRKHAATVKELLSGMRHLDRFSGFNYSKGKKITLDLYAKP